MYNCEKQISGVISQFTGEICEAVDEILIIDNRSKDKSIEIAKSAATKIKNIKVTIIQNDDNYSLGGSHKVAFKYAENRGYDYLIVLHGDNQGNILNILPYLKSGEYQNHDSFLGSRFMIGSKLVGYSKFRTFANIIFNLFCSVVVCRWITDQGSGLNMYKISYLQNVPYHNLPDGLVFPNGMFFYGVFAKSKFKFFPILWREDGQISNARIFKQGFKVLNIVLRYKSYYAAVTSQINKKKYSYTTIHSQ